MLYLQQIKSQSNLRNCLNCNFSLHKGLNAFRYFWFWTSGLQTTFFFVSFDLFIMNVYKHSEIQCFANILDFFFKLFWASWYFEKFSSFGHFYLTIFETNGFIERKLHVTIQFLQNTLYITPLLYHQTFVWNMFWYSFYFTNKISCKMNYSVYLISREAHAAFNCFFHWWW